MAAKVPPSRWPRQGEVVAAVRWPLSEAPSSFRPPPSVLPFATMSDSERLKRLAAADALTHVRSGMRLGLGTGSTMAHFVDLLADELDAGRLTDIVGVPTSVRTEEQATGRGISLAPLHEIVPLDLAVDGADEFDPALDLVKGLGGALVREKIVAQEAERFIVIVDASKEVSRLGEKAPLPVEVVPYAWESHLPFLRETGGEPELRLDASGEPYRTDNGNFILDVHYAGGIEEAHILDAGLAARAGVVDSGLFLGMASTVIVATPDGIRTVERPA